MNTTLITNGTSAKMNDEQFFEFCVAHKDLRVERTSDLEVVIMAPVGGSTGDHESEVNTQLRVWSRKRKDGKTFSSSTAFKLPDRSVLSPDAAWVALERWNALSKKERDSFPPLCPEFVIEICSKSDSIAGLKQKMELWLANGCQLAWLLDPVRQVSWIYRPNRAPEKIVGFARKLKGESPVRGFALDLSLLDI